MSHLIVIVGIAKCCFLNGSPLVGQEVEVEVGRFGSWLPLWPNLGTTDVRDLSPGVTHTTWPTDGPPTPPRPPPKYPPKPQKNFHSIWRTCHTKQIDFASRWKIKLTLRLDIHFFPLFFRLSHSGPVKWLLEIS